MLKKTRQNKRRKKDGGMNLDHVCTAIDLMLAGHDSVVGPDFVITRRDPYNADIGHLDPKALHTFDQGFVDTLVGIEAGEKVNFLQDLKKLCQLYMEQRALLSEYHGKIMQCLFDRYDMQAAKELGNFDTYLDKIVIRNNAEMNVFYDYIALYREIGDKRSIVNWRLENPAAITKENKGVVEALEKAKFALLRLDKNLEHGAIRVTNVITQTESILMDRALNASRKEGCFFICSILDRGDYLMTSGGGIPIDPKSSAGKSALTLLKPHFDQIKTAGHPVNKDIKEGVRKIYGFCLRAGALEYMTVQ